MQASVVQARALGRRITQRRPRQRGTSDARQRLHGLAKHVKAAWSEDKESVSLDISQRFSTTMQSENAGAILRRFHVTKAAHVDPLDLEGDMWSCFRSAPQFL